MYNISYMLYHTFYVYTYTYIHRYTSTKMRDVYLFLQFFIYINMYINCKKSHILGDFFICSGFILPPEKNLLSLYPYPARYYLFSFFRSCERMKLSINLNMRFCISNDCIIYINEVDIFIYIIIIY